MRLEYGGVSRSIESGDVQLVGRQPATIGGDERRQCMSLNGREIRRHGGDGGAVPIPHDQCSKAINCEVRIVGVESSRVELTASSTQIAEPTRVDKSERAWQSTIAHGSPHA
jgi:hypothetical protein